MLVADKNKSLKEKGQKTSKRKLFSGQSVSASGEWKDGIILLIMLMLGSVGSKM